MPNATLATLSLNRRLAAGRMAYMLTAALLLTTIALPGAAVAQDAALKIGVVNLDEVAARSAAGRALSAQLDTFQQQARAEVEAKTAEARSIRQQIADGANTLSQSRLAELQKQYEDKQIDIRRLNDDKQREGQKIQNEGLRRIESELAPIFESLVADGQYDIILNQVPGVVVGINPRVDLTPVVIERLNADG